MKLMKKYNLNPRIREIIEKQKSKSGENLDISNVEAENIIEKCFLGKYPSIKEYSEKSKKRLLYLIYDIDINNYKKEKLLNFYNYLITVFNDNELDGIVKHMVGKYYRPGYVYANLRSFNDNILYLISLSNIPTYKGVVINTTFVGDMIKIFPNINFDEKGFVTDDTTDMISDFIDNIKNDIPNIKISVNDKIITFVVDNDENIDILTNKFNGLKIDLIPVHFFNWK